MPKAIRIHQTGGPEVLQWEEVEVPVPSAGEVQLRQTAVGLNFIDPYLGCQWSVGNKVTGP